MAPFEGSAQGSRWIHLILLFFFAVAMAYLEAAVVVYLRKIYYTQGFSFPLQMIDKKMLVVEIGRELATIVMLLTVSLIAGRSFYERFAMLSIAFAVWDIFYYVWLKVLLGWPESLFTWDILFLIPLPWVGPVLSPVAVSLSLILGAALILNRLWFGGVFAPDIREWLIASGGAFLIMLSYILDFQAGVGGAIPRPYRWDLLLVGLAAGFYALARTLARTKEGSACDE